MMTGKRMSLCVCSTQCYHDCRCIQRNLRHLAEIADDRGLQPVLGATQRSGRVASRKWNLSRYSMIMMFIVVCLVRATNAVAFSGAMGVDFTKELIYDRSEPPQRNVFYEKRQESSGNTILRTRTTSTPSSASLPDATLSSSPLPSPFDNVLGNNFTAPSCPVFFQNFLANSSFTSCLPLSLLLKTSNGFFNAQHTLFYLTRTLDKTCQVDFNKCSALMSSLADQIKQDSNCGADYRLQNPMVQMAYSGFEAYQPLYHAGCMVNNSTGSFCYAEAVTNTSSSSGSYVYYLPLGFAMPGGAQPTCNSCLKQTMAVFASAAMSGTTPALTENYSPAAQQIDTFCGPTFVQASVKASSASDTRGFSRLHALTSVVAILTAWLLL